MAVHVELSGRVRVAAPPREALRFFTPEGERLYEADWDPEYLHPADGALGEGLTFRTRHGGELTLWLVSRCDLEAGAIDYLRVTPGSRMGVVSVRLGAVGTKVTDVTIAYRLTALSREGERTLDAFAEQFDAMLQSWERAIAALIGTPG